MVWSGLGTKSTWFHPYKLCWNAVMSHSYWLGSTFARHSTTVTQTSCYESQITNMYYERDMTNVSVARITRMHLDVAMVCSSQTACL